MKYLLILVVLSAGQAFGQNAYGSDYLILHCTAPDIGGNASFGDFPKPGLAPSSSVNGNAVLYCDASSANIKVSFNGGAYGTFGGGLPAGLSFSAPTLTISTSGSGNGVLALSGNTSGTATCTAPAIAGTTSNPLVCSNALQLPSLGQGVAGLNFAGSTGFFTSDTTNHWMIWGSAAQDWFGMKNNAAGVGMNSGLVLAWVPGNNVATGVADTGISRQGVGMAACGNGSSGDETCLWRSANACHVTTDVTLPVNTATTVCSWSLPAVAKSWAWQCQIPWVISAGTGTNTLAIIANPSQTPTAATNGSAEIKTTNTNTATEATTAISASGATTLLTSGTITPGATVFMSSTSGTLLASATAGTFSIQMTAAGTTATAAAKAGATCLLY